MANNFELGALIIALAVLFLLILYTGNIIGILIDSLIAIGILFLLNALFGLGIPINILTVLIVVIGGLIGLLLVIILRLLNVGFLNV